MPSMPSPFDAEYETIMHSCHKMLLSTTGGIPNERFGLEFQKLRKDSLTLILLVLALDSSNICFNAGFEGELPKRRPLQEVTLLSAFLSIGACSSCHGDVVTC
jgi:hypothetical protein